MPSPDLDKPEKWVVCGEHWLKHPASNLCMHCRTGLHGPPARPQIPVTVVYSGEA